MNKVKLELPIELAQALADYLVKKPYGEVAHLVQALQQLKPIQQSTADGEDDAS